MNVFSFFVFFLWAKNTLVGTVYPTWDTNDIFSMAYNAIFFDVSKNFKFPSNLCNRVTNKCS